MIAVGQTIGNYQITAKLGEGGMGVVYLAEHPVIGRRVALKAIHPELARNAEVVSRFVTEAKAVNQIGNEHIVDIHDFGTTPDGEFYFIMEFLQGEALVDRLKRAAPLEPALALGIAGQVTDALAASHRHHIVHRDLKPENIFLINKGHSADFVKVLDFGLAKLTQGEDKVSHKTRTGSVMGTPYYMSPEQCEGKPNIDHRSDIYSLGVILFEMSTGKIPFGGDGYGEIIVKHITAPVPSPRAINPRLPVSVEAIILRALAKRRDDRFQSMDEMAAALLDPEGYAASAPSIDADAAPSAPMAIPTTNIVPPSGRPENAVSGQVVFGETPVAQVGAPSAPMPSTFRNAAGELAGQTPDDDDDLDSIKPRRRTGLVLGIAAAVVAAGVAAYVFTRPTPPDDNHKATTTATETEPPKPKKVRLSLKSDPAGAVVVRKDTDEQLGITPFVVELPVGDKAIDLVFRKDEYREKSESFVPTESGQIAVALVAVPPPPQVEQHARTEAKTDTDTKPNAGGRRKGSSGSGTHKRPGLPVDEDGVLTPNF